MVGNLLADTWRGVAIFRGSSSVAPDEGSSLVPDRRRRRRPPRERIPIRPRK